MRSVGLGSFALPPTTQPWLSSVKKISISSEACGVMSMAVQFCPPSVVFMTLGKLMGSLVPEA